MGEKSKLYLKKFLNIAPLSHALWRACEAMVFCGVDIVGPSLDLGCGFGEFAGVVFDNIEVGIDINKKDLVLANKSKSYNKTMFANAKDLPFRNGSFNTVISVSVLEHIDEPALAIKEASRVLKKGGMFYLTVPTLSVYKNLLISGLAERLELGKVSDVYNRAHKKAFKHESIYSKTWWLNNLKKHEFEVLEVRGTVSPNLLKLHELFLPLALPSEVGKRINNKRFVILKSLRALTLTPAFSKAISLDENSDINIFISAQKK